MTWLPGADAVLARWRREEVANTEAALRELFDRAAGHGELLLVVDQLHRSGRSR